MKPVLVVSNGHGEDLIGAALAQELRALGYAIQAVPLVGRGQPYEKAGFCVRGPRREMPSGGFALQSPKAFWADLRAGWVSMSLAHYRAVREAAREAVATLVVGDVYALLVGHFMGRPPLFLMQCRSSLRAWERRGWSRPYSALERFLMRRAVGVYPREPEGEQWLKARGVPQACYLGNPMLDALEGVPLEPAPPYLLLLPGSRSDAYQSLPRMLEAVRLLGGLGLTPVVAWAGLPIEPLYAPGWRLETTGLAEGVTHCLSHPDGTAVYLTQGAFKATLLGAGVAISTSGTAAEQAAGYGVPLVGFPTLGPQYTQAFAEQQKRLLGEALMLVPPHPEAIAQGVRRFWDSPELRAQARRAGRAAMGEPGAARRIAQKIHQELQARGLEQSPSR
ncbi:MAG: lipid-A-disaccharide synthase-related protein [Meiothermus sp.]|uniref:lipid-A-disaccharide synthase-related protein n=1 Tax=Meiothermus sp. TaxID=1955249 RepID=UPI0025D6CD68|nr:lipid-A-disaccharide synthase-related protein [Meiothermus sp.]MCS7069641.1 lipid-A-disaccharide synthase-related protein [Meiothermus sp.]